MCSVASRRNFSLCCVVVAMSSAAVAMVITPSVASATKRAMELSNKANIDPSFADEACKLWHSVLCVDGDDIRLPLSALPAAHALYASTLARVGRDEEALVQHDKSLSYFDECNASKQITKAEADVLLAKSKSLQRLMRYRDAIVVLNGISSRCNKLSSQDTPDNISWLYICHSEAVERAALCSMRIGDLDSSILILEQFEKSIHDENLSPNVAGMLGASLLLKASSTGKVDESYQKALQLLQYASDSSVSPIYSFVHHITTCEGNGFNPFDSFTDIYALFAEANNSPFDDPGLINLDDKVRLHTTIKEYEAFCPSGYVLPSERDALERDCKHEINSDKLTWMLKDRAGYGSHGNIVATTTEVLSIYDCNKSAKEQEESKLCQRIVHPPMLLNGRKYSLRVYVIYFPEGDVLTLKGKQAHGSEVYVSTEGLVKFASALYIDETRNDIDNQYMTNSGRGDGRSSKQDDFLYLRNEFNENNIDYELMWVKIRKSIQLVMNRYSSKQQHIDGHMCASNYISYFGLPKILGFDFMLDDKMNPWLLEVNRFPGLDPRAASDSRVKHSVQYDAWIAATERIGFSAEHMKKFCPRDYKGFSLQKL
jgi:hypothetical protein